MNSKIDFTRAKRIIEARKNLDSEQTAAIEHDVVSSLLESEVLAKDAEMRTMGYPAHGYLTPFAATEVMARELHRALTVHATDLGMIGPELATYHPLFATPTLLSEVWRLRQVIDELGIDYAAYVDIALPYWAAKGHRRVPRPLQLCAPDVIGWVLEVWTDPANRYRRPLFDGWDTRFDVDHYTGDAVQQAARALVDERLADAKRFGDDPAGELAKFIDVVMSKEDAVVRYGADLVEQAVALASKPVVADVDVEIEQVIGNH